MRAVIARLMTPAWIVVAVLLLAAPFMTDTLTLDKILDIAVLTVAIMSANLLTGATGQISLAQGAFLGIGGYTSAMLVSSAGWSPTASLPIAILISAVAGAVVGLPALRITGLHLALVSLALALVFPTLILKLGDAGGGPNGLTLDRGLSAPSWFPYTADVWTYWVLIVITIMVLVLARNVLAGGLGRSMVAIRDHEILATSMGVEVAKIKVGMFAAAGGLAGLSGWMFVMHHEFISPADLTLLLSINILLAMALGGAGTIAGPIVGAAFIRLLPDAANSVGTDALLVPAVQGVVVILAFLVLPQGIVGTFRRLVAPRAKRLPPVSGDQATPTSSAGAVPVDATNLGPLKEENAR